MSAPRIVIVDPAEILGQQSPADKVTSPVHLWKIAPELGTDQVRVNILNLDRGARFRPHSHAYDQVLYYQSGTGIVAIDGGPDVIVPPGNFVLLPREIVHMHGCTDDAPAVKLSIMRDASTTFDVECPDAWKRYLFEESTRS